MDLTLIGATDGLLSPVREGVKYSKREGNDNTEIQFYMSRLTNKISAPLIRDNEKEDYFGVHFDQTIANRLKEKDGVARAKLNTYLLLLILMIHCRKLDSKQPEKFFQNSKYVKLFLSSRLEE